MAEKQGHRPVDRLLALRETLRLIADGRKAPEAAFDELKREGMVGGTRALPQITARGQALINAHLRTFLEADGSSETTVQVPDVIIRLAQARGGQPALLDAANIEAARRFAADLLRAGMQPSMSQNWAASIMNRVPRSTAASLNPSESQLEAQSRVQQACNAIGPDCSGLLIDLCLFEKSIATLETERKWPPRSAKLAIALGLRALARHYRLST